MRNKSVSFWRNAAKSLPPQVRGRYASYFAQAEQLELALDGAIELVSRAKSLLGRAFHLPHSA